MTYRLTTSERMVKLVLDLFYYLRLDSFFLNYFYPLVYYALAIGAVVLLFYKGNAQSLNSTDDLYIFMGITILVLSVALIFILIVFTPCEATCKIGGFMFMPVENYFVNLNVNKVRAAANNSNAEPLLETEAQDYKDDYYDDRFDEKAVLIV